jgi:hypothetical protein
MANDNSDRNQQIRELVDTTDLPYREIAARFGLSHERVREIATREWRRSALLKAQYEETQRPVLSRRVALLPFSTRTLNCLRNADGDLQGGRRKPTETIVTVSDLLLWSVQDLLAIKNLGRKCVEEISAWAAAQDLVLLNAGIEPIERLFYEKCPHCEGTGRTGRKVPK